MEAVARPPTPHPLVRMSRTLLDGSKPAVCTIAALFAPSLRRPARRLQYFRPSLPTVRVRQAAAFMPRAQLQEGLEAASVSLAEASLETNTVHVKFMLQRECLFGQQFFIVGNEPSLGLWDTSSAVPLEWSEGHVWTAEMDLPVDKPVKYKFILSGLSGEIEWQPGEDRVLQPWETTKVIVVTEEWDNAEKQRIAEEDQGNVGEQTVVDKEPTPVSNNVLAEDGMRTNETFLTAKNTDISTKDGFIHGADKVEIKQNQSDDKAVLVPGLNREPSLVSGLPLSPSSRIEWSGSSTIFTSGDKLAAVSEEGMESAVKSIRGSSYTSPRSGEFEDSPWSPPEDGPDSSQRVENKRKSTTMNKEPSVDEPNQVIPYSDLAVEASGGGNDSIQASEVVRNDIRWGKEKINRFLSTLGLFLGESA